MIVLHISGIVIKPYGGKLIIWRFLSVPIDDIDSNIDLEADR